MSKRKIGFMLDIETFGLSEGSAVAQIALVPYLINDPLGYMKGFVISLPAQPQLDLGRGMEAGTMDWWFDQCEVAVQQMRESLKAGTHDVIFSNLVALAEFVRDLETNYEIVELYSKGAGFDTRICKNLFSQFSVNWPFNYKLERDLRTLMALADLSKDEVSFQQGLTPHVAVDDARHQIAQLEVSLERLKINR